MEYVNYDFYINEYGGNTVPEASFIPLIREAGYYVNMFTLNRIKQDNLNDCIKFAVCKAAEVIQKLESTFGKTSERVGDYAVSYNDGKAARQKMIYDAVKPFLLPTGLLYRGVNGA